MERPKCPRCKMPLDLVPSMDEPGEYELDCNSLRTRFGIAYKPAWAQDDSAFQRALNDLPGDWVVRLGLQDFALSIPLE